MSSLPPALVISNFPIVAATADAVFRTHYRVQTRSWKAYIEQPVPSADLVIVDVTTIDRDVALALLARMLPSARVVVCSLHTNEVEVYRIDPTGLRTEGAFPSLLEFRSRSA